MKHYKNLETGVIWSASDLDLVRRLDSDKNYIIIPIIKDGAVDIKAAGPSFIPKDPEDLITENNGPFYDGFFKNPDKKEIKKDPDKINSKVPKKKAAKKKIEKMGLKLDED